MAHFAKYQATALGNMLGHYKRLATARGFERENVDPERSWQNYDLRERADQLGFVRDRIEGLHLKRRPRKDAVRVVDCVVTMPRDYHGDQRVFFEAVADTLDEMFGSENAVGAWVHLDEATPHLHYSFVPVTEDGRLSAKSILTRSFLNSFHPRLERGVAARLGTERVGLTLSPEEHGRRQLNHLSQREYIDAQRALDEINEQVEQANRRLESVQADLAPVQEEARRLSQDVLRAQREHRLLQAKRGRALAEERRAREEYEVARERNEDARMRNEDARDRLVAAQELVMGWLGSLLELPRKVYDRLSTWSQDMAFVTYRLPVTDPPATAHGALEQARRANERGGGQPRRGGRGRRL